MSWNVTGVRKVGEMKRVCDCFCPRLCTKHSADADEREAEQEKENANSRKTVVMRSHHSERFVGTS